MSEFVARVCLQGTPSSERSALVTPSLATTVFTLLSSNDTLSSGGRAESRDTTRTEPAAAVCRSGWFGRLRLALLEDGEHLALRQPRANGCEPRHSSTLALVEP